MGLLNKVFYRIGLGVTRHPFIVFASAFLVTALAGLSFINFRSTDDPQELWVPKSSRANLEQEYFQSHFGSFFRINEAFVSPVDPDKDTQDIFRPAYLHLLYYFQLANEQGVVEKDGKNYTLDDFCYKPISGKP